MCSLTVSSKTTTYLLVLWYATFSVNVPYSPSFVVLCMKLYWNLCRPWSSTDFNEAIMYIKISLKDCSATFLYPKTGNSPALRMNCCALFTSRKWFWLIMILVTVDFKCFTVNYKIPVGIGDFVIIGQVLVDFCNAAWELHFLLPKQVCWEPFNNHKLSSSSTSCMTAAAQPCGGSWNIKHFLATE